MLLKLLPPWAWICLITANCLMGIASALVNNFELMLLNGLSATGCLVGYISVTKLKGD